MLVVLSGSDVILVGSIHSAGTLRLQQFLTRNSFSSQSFETNRPGIFAVGDVRRGSVKRVAAAVGEGSACVQQVHQALQN
jgi:thioredoxin reductase